MGSLGQVEPEPTEWESGMYCRAVGGGMSPLVVGGGECRARTGYVARVLSGREGVAGTG